LSDLTPNGCQIPAKAAHSGFPGSPAMGKNRSGKEEKILRTLNPVLALQNTAPKNTIPRNRAFIWVHWIVIADRCILRRIPADTLP